MRVKRPVSGLNAIGSAMIAILLLTVGYLCSVVACCLRLRHLFLLLLSPCLAPLCCYDDLLLVLLLLLLLLLLWASLRWESWKVGKRQQVAICRLNSDLLVEVQVNRFRFGGFTVDSFSELN